MRKNIFEILESKYDIEGEFDKIVRLFFNNLSTYSYIYTLESVKLTIENMVENIHKNDNQSPFSKWKQRSVCLNCEEMRHKLHIRTDNYSNDKIITLEYFCNLINILQRQINRGLDSSYSISSEYYMLCRDIDILLEHLNYEKHVFEEEEKVIIIPKNPAATAVAEISSESTAMAILMYHHASLKGQLEEKRDILRRIAKEYEPLLDKGIDGFSDYFDKATNMLNNLDIRHNNKAGKKKNALAINLSDEELENWYDELYQLLLFCVLIKDNKERKDKVAEFLKVLKDKK